MLITAGIYAISLFATLSSALFFVSLIFTVICIVFLKRNLFPAKYIVIWVLIFYFGIINTSVRLKATDDLLNMAPINSEISGTIVSIPQGKNEGRVKFFFDAENIKFGSRMGGSTILLPFGFVQWHQHAMQFHHRLKSIKELI